MNTLPSRLTAACYLIVTAISPSLDYPDSFLVRQLVCGCPVNVLLVVRYKNSRV